MTSFRAAVLDFDGLILDTEGACYAAWRALFQAHGADYTVEDNRQLVGSVESAHALFEARCGRPEDWTPLDGRRREIEAGILAELAVQPGVLSLLDQARALGLATAVASSSSHRWVDRLLGEHGLLDGFDAIICREDVGHPKPEPDLYLEAVRRLGAEPRVTVAFEDSAYGALAARRAQVWCVAVPTPMTAGQDFSPADLVVPTLAGIDLRALLAGLAGRGGSPGPRAE
jgi:HAD superfamily hydrolase (TIGR01509 family)